MNFPTAFSDNLKDILGNEYTDFEASLLSESPVSIRFNPAKPFQSDLAADGAIPWAREGVYLHQRPVFTLDPAFHAGGYYVQEASSMFIDFIFNKYVDRSQPVRVLDLSAAPGGKATLIASQLGNEDLLVANEVIKSRVKILKENLTKWGYSNVIITNQDPETFADLEGFFDVVLVDAPCSGEGLFRKNPEAVNEWSEENVMMCSARQKRILSAAAMLVAPKGLLIYSTCTYNPYENQQNAEWLTRTLNFENVEIEIPLEWNIAQGSPGLQFFPHKVRGEGFYVAAFRNLGRDAHYVKGRPTLSRLLRKESEWLKPWIKADQYEQFEYFLKNDGKIVAIRKSILDSVGSVFKALVKRSSGLELGLFKGKDFIPDHSFALSELVSDGIPRIELSREEALLYLKKENMAIDTTSEGWVLVCYKNLSLGWIKTMGNRINNYFPTEWRIRMGLES